MFIVPFPSISEIYTEIEPKSSTLTIWFTTTIISKTLTSPSWLASPSNVSIGFPVVIKMAVSLERAKGFEHSTSTLARLFDRNPILQNLRFFKRKSLFYKRVTA